MSPDKDAATHDSHGLDLDSRNPIADTLLSDVAGPDRRLVGIDAAVCGPEICNGYDDDLDGQTDEGYDKLTDVNYCEECAGCDYLTWLEVFHAVPECKNGKCAIKECLGNTSDEDQVVTNGCEQCTYVGQEVCNGADDDCNGTVDEGCPIADIPIPEKCNEHDEDFDTLIDEDFPNKGMPCDNGKMGVCFGMGTFVCAPDGKSTICDAPCC